MPSIDFDNIEINNELLKEIRNHIYFVVRTNNKTRSLNNSQLTDKLRLIIERAIENDN